jgi:hypothetical protein
MNNTSKVHLLASTKQMRDGKLLLRGDPFTASSEEASDLVALNFASVVDHSADEEAKPPPSKSQKPALRSKDQVAAKSSGAKPLGGRYGRKDLRAAS